MRCMRPTRRPRRNSAGGPARAARARARAACTYHAAPSRAECARRCQTTLSITSDRTSSSSSPASASGTSAAGVAACAISASSAPSAASGCMLCSKAKRQIGKAVRAAGKHGFADPDLPPRRLRRGACCAARQGKQGAFAKLGHIKRKPAAIRAASPSPPHQRPAARGGRTAAFALPPSGVTGARRGAPKMQVERPRRARASRRCVHTVGSTKATPGVLVWWPRVMACAQFVGRRTGGA